MSNPLGPSGPFSRQPSPCCQRCRATPCRCPGQESVPSRNNPLAGPPCPYCLFDPCRCLTRGQLARLCRRCGYQPCRCGEAPPCVPAVPFDDYAECPRGYQVGDVLTVAGGTFVTAATLTVLTINAETGSVLMVAVTTPGNYTVFPANPAATTGGGGTGATFTLAGVLPALTGAVVVAGGGPWPPGYRVGDVCQLDGGIFTAAASVVVTATTSGQVAGVAIRTPGSGYSSLPCSPTPTFGGHGCGLKITATFVGGAMTIAVVADMGGTCHPPPLQWWQRTSVNIFSPGSGPPAQPRVNVCGRLICGWSERQQILLDPCSPPAIRPLTYLWFPLGTDCNAMCCSTPGDVIEAPAKSGRLYNVFYTEYVDVDTPGCSPGPPAAPFPPVCGEFVGGYMLVVLQQQCPFGAASPPTGTWLTDDSGADVLYGDPWHYLEPV